MAQSRIQILRNNNGIEILLPRISGRFHWFWSILLSSIIIAVMFVCVATNIIAGVFEWVTTVAFLVMTMPALYILAVILLNISATKSLKIDSSGIEIKSHFYGKLFSVIFVPCGQLKSFYRDELPVHYNNTMLKIEDYYRLLRRRGELASYLRNETVKPRFYDRLIFSPGNFGSFTKGGGIVLTTNNGTKLIICDHLSTEETNQLADALENQLQQVRRSGDSIRN